ncbi:Galactokinase [Austwickia sp. TVS 96-490-7B]|uniref:galactokinase n=1 Tax=Austwickia sp. TVS 96-490-7B TaxID=2830843 RepID=UPI001D3F6322|nr:galactokinase [Austwickia sp. TVS 96-490-7B]MBW3083897.1 Galactokinase [Austwickia sp. TVS 96-490-7B]
MIHNTSSRCIPLASGEDLTWLTAWSDEEGAHRARHLLRDTYDVAADGVWAAPGRVNLIGEHVDYNAGLCLPLALPHRAFLALRARDDHVVRLVTDLNQPPWEGTLDQIRPGGVTGWVAYVAGPAWALADSSHDRRTGFDAALVSCVPLGAGLSSSAAVACVTAIALDETWGLGLSNDDSGRAQLADACVRAENHVAGAPTGGMDQSASLRCTSDHGLLLDCQDASGQQVPLALAAAGLALLVIDTRAPHALTDGHYGRRRADCEAAAVDLGVASLREIADRLPPDRTSPDQDQPLIDVLAHIDDPTRRRRVRHVLTEIARVRHAAAQLATDDWVGLGHTLNASHDSLRDDYEVTCRELDLAVDTARAAGALGARMTGGGFGGSAIALVNQDRVDQVSRAVADAFAAHQLIPPAFLLAQAAAGAGRMR